MDSDLVADTALDALWVLGQIIAPVVLPAMLTALIVGLLQAATSISEATLSFVPKLVTVLVMLALFGAVMMRTLADFTVDLFGRVPVLLR